VFRFFNENNLNNGIAFALLCAIALVSNPAFAKSEKQSHGAVARTDSTATTQEKTSTEEEAVRRTLELLKSGKNVEVVIDENGKASLHATSIKK